MAKLLVYAGVMELQSIELEVCLRKSPLLIADLGVIFGVAGCGLAALSNGFQRYPGPDHGYARKGQTGGNDGRPVRHRPYGQYGEASHRKDSYAARQANIPDTREVGAASGEAPPKPSFTLAATETYAPCCRCRYRLRRWPSCALRAITGKWSSV
jgi:hypothetical protein